MFNDIVGELYYFMMKMYVVCINYNGIIEAILMSTCNIPFFYRRVKKHP